ncbi:hypothetical protein IQ07DRAFT_567822 [Pyrenochaeta sp. DS3sAY3a]|nr:hypothetical protein IQ07DRAFT_567822 [Pyrenochaeta sp. DS3sAY3a]
MTSSSDQQAVLDKANAYYKNFTHISQYIRDPAPNPTEPPSSTSSIEKGVQDVRVAVSEEDRIASFQKEFLYIGGPEVVRKKKKSKSRRSINMPVHPAEETAGGITDKVAKESSDSTASSHKLHDEVNQATSGGSVAANAHKANPGPVQADNLPTPASKEELKKRAEELNN